MTTGASAASMGECHSNAPIAAAAVNAMSVKGDPNFLLDMIVP
jgi:hypothetical protein